MEITAVGLKSPPPEDPDCLALGTVVLDGEFMLRNLRLVEVNGEKTVRVPRVRDHERFLNPVEILDEELRKRITERFIERRKSFNPSA